MSLQNCETLENQYQRGELTYLYAALEMNMFSIKQTGLFALKLEKEKKKRREIRKSIIRKRVRKFEKEIFRDKIFENDDGKDEIEIDGVSFFL